MGVMQTTAVLMSLQIYLINRLPKKPLQVFDDDIKSQFSS
jgi:hypothetical protein